MDPLGQGTFVSFQPNASGMVIYGVVDNNPGFDGPADAKKARVVELYATSIHGRSSTTPKIHEVAWEDLTELDDGFDNMDELIGSILELKYEWDGVRHSVEEQGPAKALIMFLVHEKNNPGHVVMTRANGREEAKRKASDVLTGDPDFFVVTPLTPEGSDVTLFL